MSPLSPRAYPYLSGSTKGKPESGQDLFLEDNSPGQQSGALEAAEGPPPPPHTNCKETAIFRALLHIRLL